MKPVLFISDLHLDPTRPRVSDLFLDFLAGEARTATALYILGDLFEAWIGDDDPEPEHARVIAGLRAAVDSGVPIFVMHGNRDFLLGDDFARRSGAQQLPDSLVIELFGTPTLLLHGDTLCTDDQAYQDFRAMVRDAGWQGDFLARPIHERQAIARQLRETSQRATRGKPEYITDVNAAAVADSMRTAGVRQLIHGHTHRPAVHDFELDGQAARRIVLGDWYEQGSLLRCTEAGCRLELLPVG
ncbi:MAG TPA: UDP-2,3-diacylglucosamine diphosphatase [Gammaproteobacteria bacterium]